IRHTQSVVVTFLRVKGGDGYRADGTGVGAERDTQLIQKLGRYGACGYPADGLTAGGAAAAPGIPEAVFGVKGKSRWSGPVEGGNIRVVPGTLGGVPHQKGDGSSCGLSFKDTGEDLHRVILLPGGGEAALPGFPSVKIDLDILP